MGANLSSRVSREGDETTIETAKEAVSRIQAKLGLHVASQGVLATAPRTSNAARESIPLVGTANDIHIAGGSFNSAAGNIVQISNHNFISSPTGPSSLDMIQALKTKEILDWICPLNVMNSRAVQMDIYEKATAGTGYWIFTSNFFQEWYLERGGTLWGTGMPGAGKTILMSIIVTYMQREAEISKDISLAFAYCSQTDGLTLRDILADLARQKLERALKVNPAILATIEPEFERHKAQNTRPSQPELLDIIRSSSQPFKRNVYSLDAVDELPSEMQVDLLQVLSSLDPCHLIITSRPLELWKRRLEVFHHFEVVAQPQDIRLLVEQKINLNVGFCSLLERHDLKEEIIREILKKSKGMFLYASLQIDMLRHCLNIRQLRIKLAKFPTKLEELYADTLIRINRLDDDNVQLARRVLLWLTYTARSLTVQELLYAIAVVPDTHDIDEDCMIDEPSMISMCCGLVTVDKKSGFAHLIHGTAKDALKNLLANYFPDPNGTLSLTCTSLLTACKIPATTLQSEDGLRSILDSTPLLAYAYQFWAFHAKASKKVSTQDVVDFLLQCGRYPFSNPFKDYRFSGRLDTLGPLQVAAYYDLSTAIQYLVKNKQKLSAKHHIPTDDTWQINSKTPEMGLTPLMLASLQGHHIAIETILKVSGREVNLQCKTGDTALMLGARRGQGKAVQYLVSVSDTDVNTTNQSGATALMLAMGSSAGTALVQEHLLGHRSINVNTADVSGYTALMRACVIGDVASVERLLGSPHLEVNSYDFAGNTALMLAARYGRIATVRCLLHSPKVKIDLVNKHSRTAMMEAEAHRQHGVVEIFREMMGRGDYDGLEGLKVGGIGGQAQGSCVLTAPHLLPAAPLLGSSAFDKAHHASESHPNPTMVAVSSNESLRKAVTAKRGRRFPVSFGHRRTGLKWSGDEARTTMN